MATCLKPANALFGTLETAPEAGERQELTHWLDYARFSPIPGSPTRGYAGQLVCRLPFNLAMEDRFGHRQVLMVRSHTVSDRAAVIFSRRRMPLFNEVRIQLDDGTNRAWVRAKVTDNVPTIGGQLVRVEYLAHSAAGS